MEDDIDRQAARRDAGERPDGFFGERLTHDLGQCAERVGGRRRVGGVGLDEQLRPFAAHELPLEVDGDGDDVGEVAGRQPRVGRCLARRRRVDAK